MSLKKKEATKACEILGVSNEQISFLNAGDGRLDCIKKDEKVIREKILCLIEKYQPDSILIPWRRDHHSDHVATNKLVKDIVAKKNILIVEYPVWLWKKGLSEDWPDKKEVLPYRLDIDSVKILKKKAVFSHESQTTKLIHDDDDGFILTQELLEPFFSKYEYFFFPSVKKPTVGKEYFDELYSKDLDPWNFETSHYEHQKYIKTLNSISDRKINHALEIGCSNGVFTALLAPYCKNLLALDHNEIAIESARVRCLKFPQCQILQWDITKGLPDNNFDLIFLSEIGYYFEYKVLKKILADIFSSLLPGGILVMVHWTSYVRSYPLTGLEVHEYFKNNYSRCFKLSTEVREDLYELLVWEKLEK